MIDIGNDNLDNELNIEKYNAKLLKFRGSNDMVKHSMILKNGKIIDLRTEEEIINERNFWIKSTKDKMFMTTEKQSNTDLQSNNNPKYLEYWRNIFPTKTDNELEEYRTKWSKENPKYLKFERL